MQWQGSKRANYVDSLPPDVRKRYDSKTACIKCDPYCIATTEWGKDVSKWPLIGFLDVINYLVHSPSAYTSEQLKKYKSLEAYKFYQDGWIRQILHKKIGELHLVLAKVITARLNVSESFRFRAIRMPRLGPRLVLSTYLVCCVDVVVPGPGRKRKMGYVTYAMFL